MLKEVPKILVVTRAVLCEKFKVGGSVARALIKELAKRGVILPIGTQHHSFDLYKGSQAKSATEKAEADAAEAAKGKKKKAQDDWSHSSNIITIKLLIPSIHLTCLVILSALIPIQVNDCVWNENQILVK